MKKLYFLLFFAFSFQIFSQNINFTDFVFKSVLTNSGVGNFSQIAKNLSGNYFAIDANSDGEISITEAEQVLELHLDGRGINDIIGIEYFTNLIQLHCSDNNISSISLINTNLNLEYINCNSNGLNSLIIENLNSLISIETDGNNLTQLDFYTLNNLENLQCSSNNLTSLILPQSLRSLFCGQNNLTSLNLSGLNNLFYIDANQNQLTNFVTTSSILEFVNLNNNNLTEFTFTSLNYTEGVSLSNNQISHIYSNFTQVYVDSLLDLSNNLLTDSSELDFLTFGGLSFASMIVSNNQFTQMDFGMQFQPESTLKIGNNIMDSISFLNSQPGKIICETDNYNVDFGNFNRIIDCDPYNSGNLTIQFSPNLEFVNLKNGFDHTEITCNNGSDFQVPALNLQIQNCPNLNFICVDTGEMQFIQNKINQLGLQNQINVNSYCSFTPGGTIYEISGNAKIDTNSNGCDVTDLDYPNLKFVITDGTNSGSFISNNSGDYYIPVQAGNYTITPNLENPTYFNISPANFTVDFPIQGSPFTQDFCVTANGLHSDVEVMVMPTTPALPGFDAVYKIVYINKGNQVENGTVSLTFDDAVLDYVTSNPVYDSNATNSFTWNYNNLQPFETREIEITFNVNSPMDSPAVNIDDVLDYSVAIITSNIEETPDDNTFELNQTVVGSYDPNDKTCLEGETVDVATVGKYVHYVIRFENTGTYPAQNIVVKDMIDISKFDVSTLVPLNGSHEFYTRIKDNKVEFIFENINLDFNDATNDGYVSFKIKTLPTLTVGETFSNDANIYFDYNFPITTNEYVTTIQNVLSNQDFAFENEFVLYPNPAKEVLNISSKNQTEISSIEIYNIVGQVVIAIPNATKTIDVSNLETGTYFIKVNTEKGSTTTKFVKE